MGRLLTSVPQPEVEKGHRRWIPERFDSRNQRLVQGSIFFRLLQEKLLQVNRLYQGASDLDGTTPMTSFCVTRDRSLTLM